MKHTLILIALFCALFTRAQEKITYLNEHLKSTKEKEAVLLEQRVKRNDTCWEVNTYAIFGPRITSMQFRDVNDRIVGKRDSGKVYEEGKKDSAARAQGRTFTKVEIESEFPGGAAGWSDYLNQHLTYPKRAVSNEIQGMPVVTFIVEKDGHVDPSNVYIERSVEFSLDKEALKAINESPNWTAAVQDGRPVRSYKKQPFVFKLTAK